MVLILHTHSRASHAPTKLRRPVVANGARERHLSNTKIARTKICNKPTPQPAVTPPEFSHPPQLNRLRSTCSSMAVYSAGGHFNDFNRRLQDQISRVTDRDGRGDDGNDGAGLIPLCIGAGVGGGDFAASQCLRGLERISQCPRPCVDTVRKSKTIAQDRLTEER